VEYYDDFLAFRLAKLAGKVILDFGKWNLFHSGFPNCASHVSASLFATIAKTWTVFPTMS